MDKILKGSVIGAGKMGLLHSAILNRMPQAQLVSICETDSILRNSFQKFTEKINIYSDYQEMLETEQPDFTFITTPSHLHVPMGIACIKQGSHFFIEKPLSTNGIEAKLLVNSLKDKKLITMIGYMMRYMASFKKAKEILDGGAIGNVISFNTKMYVSQLFKKGKGWRYDKNKSGGGVIITQASHAIDLISWFFGYPSRLNANLLSPYSIASEDFGHICFTWENGLMGWLDSSWSVFNHRLLETTIQIHGYNGNLTVNDDTIKLYLKESSAGFCNGWTILKKPELESGVIIDIAGPQYTLQNQDFINAIINKQNVESDVINGFKIQKIIDTIYYSGDNKGESLCINYNE